MQHLLIKEICVAPPPSDPAFRGMAIFGPMNAAAPGRKNLIYVHHKLIQQANSRKKTTWPSSSSCSLTLVNGLLTWNTGGNAPDNVYHVI